MSPEAISENDHYSVFISMNHHLFPDTKSVEGEQVMKLFRRKYPALWVKIASMGDMIRLRDLPDDKIRDIDDRLQFDDLHLRGDQASHTGLQ